MSARGDRDLAWVVYGLIGLLAFAVTGSLARRAALAPFLPDPGLVLLIPIAARVPRERWAVCALVIGLARAATSIDDRAAVLAGYVAVGAGLAAFRALLDLERAALRAMFAFVAALGLSAWLALVHGLRSAAGVPGPELLSRTSIGSAAVTAVALLAFGPLVAGFGPFRPLWRQR